MKQCCGCKLVLSAKHFWKNKTRPDGRQNHCIDCAKRKWGKTFACSECGSKFYVGHRNISKRKTYLCSGCLTAFRSKRLSNMNKLQATYAYMHKKGYAMTLNPLTAKYTMNHRQHMAEHLGRPLTRSEVVHHIDGDKKNNELSNLYLTNNSGHKMAHRSLELLALEMLKQGKIRFNNSNGVYEFV